MNPAPSVSIRDHGARKNRVEISSLRLTKQRFNLSWLRCLNYVLPRIRIVGDLDGDGMYELYDAGTTLEDQCACIDDSYTTCFESVSLLVYLLVENMLRCVSGR